MEGLLLSALEKVEGTRGSEHSSGLCGLTCYRKARVGYLLVLFLA